MTRLRRLLAILVLTLSAACSGGADTSSPPCPDGVRTCPPGTFGPVPATSGSATSPATQGPEAPSGTGTGTHGTPHATTAAPPVPSASRTPGTAHAESPREAGFPDARTTGHRISLTPHSTGAMSIRTDGTVIKGWDIKGSLDVYANDVTVIDSRITSDNWWGINLRPGYHGLRILHTTITAVPGKGPNNGGVDYAVSNMGTSSIEVGWCDVSVFGDALSMGQGHLHDNYVHDITPFRNLDGEWQHTNAVISNGGGAGTLVIRHNTLLNPTPVDRGASAGVGLFADAGPVTKTVIDNNWLAGGAYALYGGGPGASGIQVTDNVFSTQYHPNSGAYGVVAAWNPGGAGNIWRGNRLSDVTPVFPEPAP